VKSLRLTLKQIARGSSLVRSQVALTSVRLVMSSQNKTLLELR